MFAFISRCIFVHSKEFTLNFSLQVAMKNYDYKKYDKLKLCYFSKIIMHVENMVIVDCVINLIIAKKSNAQQNEVSLPKFYIN
jgi:hypothetical protein